VVALALHVGGAALAIVHLQADDEGGSLGAQGTEIGLDLTSLGTEVTDLPPGPESKRYRNLPPFRAESGRKGNRSSEGRRTETEDPDRVVTQADPKKQRRKSQNLRLCRPRRRRNRRLPWHRATGNRGCARHREANGRQSGNRQGPGETHRGLGAEITAIFEMHKKYPEDKKRAATVKVSLVIQPPR